MTFRVGQKVVCIKDYPDEHARFSNIGARQRSRLIHEGSIYTIREIDTRSITIHGVACLRFEGITGRMRDTCVGPWESGASFPASHFRPIVERKTDISFAHEILRKVTSKDRVRA